MNRFSALAIICIILGATLTIGPSFGISSIAADRGVQVTAADDSSAFLGITDNSESGEADLVPQTDHTGEVFFLDDNAGEFTVEDFTADVVAFNNEEADLRATVVSNEDDFDFTVEVSCGTSDRNEVGTVTVEIHAQSSLNIELDRTTEQEIELKCRSADDEPQEGDQLRYEDGSMEAGGTEETAGVTFSLEKPNPEDEIDITSLSVNTEAGAESIRGDTNCQQAETRWDPEVHVQTDNEEDCAASGNGFDLDEEIDIGITAGDVTEFYVSEFTDENGESVIMVGESVTVEVTYEYDGTEYVVSFQDEASSGSVNGVLYEAESQ